MVEPNEVLPEPFGRVCGHKPGRTAISVPRKAILASGPIATIFML
jgi:hypothetical protein